MSSNEDYRQFLIDATEGFEESEQRYKETFEKAYQLATEVHKDQYRDEGTPYISHIDGILDIIQNELDKHDYFYMTIAALHDVLEDSLDITLDQLSDIIGEPYASFVDLLTKKKGMSTEQYLKNMEDSEFNSVIIFVKLADRLHNVRSLKNIVSAKPDKVKKYIIETENYYIPLAKKYGKKFVPLLQDEIDELKIMITQ